MPYCPHCNQKAFEIEDVDIGGTKYNCVQCSGCKAPIGFVPREIIGSALDQLDTRVTEVLHVVVSTLQTVNTRLARIEQTLQTKR